MNTNNTVSRLQKFEKEFGKVDMADFYQLNKSSSHENIHIGKEIGSDSIGLTIRYKKTSPFLVFDLPYELNQLIHEYLIYVIDLKINIKYSPSYPFSPPIWFLQSVNHNLHTQVCLLDYYSHKVNLHNQSYVTYLLNGDWTRETGWTPAITVEKDLLSFVQKIYHFDEVLECI